MEIRKEYVEEHNLVLWYTYIVTKLSAKYACIYLI